MIGAEFRVARDAYCIAVSIDVTSASRARRGPIGCNENWRDRRCITDHTADMGSRSKRTIFKIQYKATRVDFADAVRTSCIFLSDLMLGEIQNT